MALHVIIVYEWKSIDFNGKINFSGPFEGWEKRGMMYIKKTCRTSYYYSSPLPTYFAFNFLQWIKWGQNTPSLAASECPSSPVKHLGLDELVLSGTAPPWANKTLGKGMLSNHFHGYYSLPFEFSIYFYSISNYFKVTLEINCGFL